MWLNNSFNLQQYIVSTELFCISRTGRWWIYSQRPRRPPSPPCCWAHPAFGIIKIFVKQCHEILKTCCAIASSPPSFSSFKTCTIHIKDFTKQLVKSGKRKNWCRSFSFLSFSSSFLLSSSVKKRGSSSRSFISAFSKNSFISTYKGIFISNRQFTNLPLPAAADGKSHTESW